MLLGSVLGITVLPIILYKVRFSILRWVNLLLNVFVLIIASREFFNYQSQIQYNKITLIELTNSWSIMAGFDGVGLAFIWLTSLIFVVVFIATWGNTTYSHLFIFLLNSIQLLLIAAFVMYDLLVYYLVFEAILIPMFLIIGLWGSRFEKVKAAYYFFFYTLVGSVSFLVGILVLQGKFGTTNLYLIELGDNSLQKILWIMFFVAFAVKIPMFPFHIWLPEAHVEAPTAGSVILAALLLKLGAFGYLRFMLPVFDKSVSQYYWPVVVMLAGGSIIYASLTAIRQIDIKRIVAYSSIAHMNLAVLGLFSGNYVALSGGLVLSVAHGFVSAAMFLLIGILYDRYHSRLVNHYSGLVRVMPLYAVMFILFSLANMGFPLSYNFVGELSIIIGLIQNGLLFGVIGLAGVLLSVVYVMWLANRLLFGDITSGYIVQFYDLHVRELSYFIILIIPTLVFGIAPDYLELLWIGDLINIV